MSEKYLIDRHDPQQTKIIDVPTFPRPLSQLKSDRSRGVK